jgi:glycerol transport system substrate-binding protein
MKLKYRAIAFAAAALVLGHSAWAGEAEAKKWVDSEFQPSTLSKDQQMTEMKWFIDAAKKLQAAGVKEISVVSETITTHEYESKTLAKAFEEITGIKVKHDLIQEGDVVEKLQTSMQSGRVDLRRLDQRQRPDRHPLPLRQDHEPDRLHVRRWQGVDQPRASTSRTSSAPSFTTGPDKQAVPTARPAVRQPVLVPCRPVRASEDLKTKFKAKYGYDLGVPLNWSAYEDIAAFFSEDVKTIDGKPIYGHMDYGKKDPSLGWRFTDAWLSMAGTADIGITERQAGRRMGHSRLGPTSCNAAWAPAVSRGGATNSPAAVYALTKYVDWMKKYAPKEATGMTFGEAGPVPAQGSDRAADLLVHRLHRRHDQAWPAGRQRGRHAEVAHGRPARTARTGSRACRTATRTSAAGPSSRAHDANKTAAAWLYAQFVTAKTTSRSRRPSWADTDPRVGHPEQGDDRPGAEARRAGGVLPQPGARRVERRPAPTCPTTRSWPSCGGRTWPRR